MQGSSQQKDKRNITQSINSFTLEEELDQLNDSHQIKPLQVQELKVDKVHLIKQQKTLFIQQSSNQKQSQEKEESPLLSQTLLQQINISSSTENDASTQWVQTKNFQDNLQQQLGQIFEENVILLNILQKLSLPKDEGKIYHDLRILLRKMYWLAKKKQYLIDSQEIGFYMIYFSRKITPNLNVISKLAQAESDLSHFFIRGIIIDETITQQQINLIFQFIWPFVIFVSITRKFIPPNAEMHDFLTNIHPHIKDNIDCLAYHNLIQRLDVLILRCDIETKSMAQSFNRYIPILMCYRSADLELRYNNPWTQSHDFYKIMSQFSWNKTINLKLKDCALIDYMENVQNKRNQKKEELTKNSLLVKQKPKKTYFFQQKLNLEQQTQQNVSQKSQTQKKSYKKTQQKSQTKIEKVQSKQQSFKVELIKKIEQIEQNEYFFFIQKDFESTNMNIQKSIQKIYQETLKLTHHYEFVKYNASTGYFSLDYSQIRFKIKTKFKASIMRAVDINDAQRLAEQREKKMTSSQKYFCPSYFSSMEKWQKRLFKSISLHCAFLGKNQAIKHFEFQWPFVQILTLTWLPYCGLYLNDNYDKSPLLISELLIKSNINLKLKQLHLESTQFTIQMADNIRTIQFPVLQKLSLLKAPNRQVTRITIAQFLKIIFDSLFTWNKKCKLYLDPLEKFSQNLVGLKKKDPQNYKKYQYEERKMLELCYLFKERVIFNNCQMLKTVGNQKWWKNQSVSKLLNSYKKEVKTKQKLKQHQSIEQNTQNFSYRQSLEMNLNKKSQELSNDEQMRMCLGKY